MKLSRYVSRILWKYEVSALNLLQALLWATARDSNLFKEEFNVKIICSVFLLAGFAQFLLRCSNKGTCPAASYWVMTIGFILTQALIHASPQARIQQETWNASSLIALASAIKIKSQLLLDSELILHSIIVVVFFLFIGQQIAVADSLESSIFGAILVCGVFLILSHHYHLCSVLELAALRREFFRQYISSKSGKDAVIFYNYSSNQVSLEKGQILRHFDDDITRSTSERLKADEIASSIYSGSADKKKDLIAAGDPADYTGKSISPRTTKSRFYYLQHKRIANASTNRPTKKESIDGCEDDVDVGCLKLQEKSLREIRQEFRHALHKFKELRSALKSRTKLTKELLITGKAVVDRSLYREYKEVDINTSVHNFKGSLRIIKFSGEEDYGIILLRRAEFKLLDIFVQRASSLQRLLSQILASSTFLTSSSWASPGAIDKSDGLLYQNHNKLLFPNTIDVNPATPSSFDSPGRIASFSNLENPGQNGQFTSAYPSNNRKPGIFSQNLILTNNNNAPPSLNNLQIQGQINSSLSQPQFVGALNPQGNLQYSQLTAGGLCGNIRSFNKIPPVFSNVFYQHSNVPCFTNPISMPSLGALMYQPPTPSLPSAQNSAINTTQQNQQGVSAMNQNGSQTFIISPPLLIAKACVYMHALKYDLREYSLSCRELNCPEYEKYRNKWVPSEVRMRKEYEDNLALRLNQGTLDQETKNILKQEENYIFCRVFQDQQAAQKIPQHIPVDVCLEAVIGNEAQTYQLSKKKQGIYNNERESIEDMYQLRTSLISVRNVLDSLSRILSAGERVQLRFSQDSSINSLAHLSPQEADRLKQVYGDQIIEENQDIYLHSYQTILNNSQEQEVNQQKIAKEGEDPFLFRQPQEEDIETFRDMLVSLIQQLYNLYKDFSTGFHISLLRFFTSSAESNPDLEFRNRFQNAVLQQSAIPFNTKIKPVYNQQLQQQQQLSGNNNNNNMQLQFMLGKQFPVKSLKNILPSNQSQLQILKQLSSKKGNDTPNSSEPSQDNTNPNPQKMTFSLFNKSSDLLKTKMLFLQQQEKQNKEDILEVSSRPKQRRIGEQLKQVQYNEDSVEDNDHVNQNSLQVGNNEINMMTEQRSQVMSSNNSQQLTCSLQQQQQLQQQQPQPQYHSHGMSQYPKKSVSVQNAHSQLLLSAPHGNPIPNQGQQDLNSNEQKQNNKGNLENKDQDSSNPKFYKSGRGNNKGNEQGDENEIGQEQQQRLVDETNNPQQKREKQQNSVRKLRATRVKVEIQQNLSSEKQTNDLIHSSAYLLQIEEFARFLSPLPMTHRRIPRDKSVTHEYVFYLDNFLYRHELTGSATEQDLEGEMMKDGEGLSESQRNKKSVNLEGKSMRESRVVSDEKDKILMVSIDAGLVKNKQKRPQTAKQRILHKISESLAYEEANQPSEIGSCSPQPPSHLSSQWQFTSSKPIDRKLSLKPQPEQAISPESFQNENFDINSDRKFLQNQSGAFCSNGQSFNNSRLDLTDLPFKQFLQDNPRNTSSNANNISATNHNNMSEFTNLNGTFNEKTDHNITLKPLDADIPPNQIKRRVYSNVSLLGKNEDLPIQQDTKSALEIEEIKTENDTHINKVYSQVNISTRIQPTSSQSQSQQHYKFNPISLSNCSTNQHVSQKQSPIVLPVDSESQMPHLALQTESDASQKKSKSQSNQEKLSNSCASEDADGRGGIDERENKELNEIIEKSEQHLNAMNSHYRNQLTRQQSSSRLYEMHPQYSFLNQRSSKTQSIVLTEDCVKPYSHTKINTFIGQTIRDSEYSFNNRSVSPHIIHSSSFNSQQQPPFAHTPQQGSSFFASPVLYQQQQLGNGQTAEVIPNKKFLKEECGSKDSSI